MDNVDNKSLYTPEGQVADKNVAEELAYLQKPAMDRETALRKEFDTGLTETQRANIEIMDGIEAKYPLALEKCIDDKGRKVLYKSGVFGNSTQTWGLNSGLVISQEGVFTTVTERVNLPVESINFTRLLDNIADGDFKTEQNGFMIFDRDAVMNKEKTPEYYQHKNFYMYTVDLGNPKIQEALKFQLSSSQEFAEKKLTEVEAKRIKLEPQVVLNNL